MDTWDLRMSPVPHVQEETFMMRDIKGSSDQQMMCGLTCEHF